MKSPEALLRDCFFQDPDVCVSAGFQHAKKEIPVFKTGTHRFIIASALLPYFPMEYMGGRTAVPGKKGSYAAPQRTDYRVKNTEGMEPGRSSGYRGILFSTSRWLFQYRGGFSRSSPSNISTRGAYSYSNLS